MAVGKLGVIIPIYYWSNDNIYHAYDKNINIILIKKRNYTNGRVFKKKKKSVEKNLSGNFRWNCVQQYGKWIKTCYLSYTNDN